MRRGILILLVALALTACGSARAQLAASSAPAVVSNCVPGLMDEATGRFHPLIQLAGVAPWSLHDATTGAYRLSLTNRSNTAAQVFTFTVLFYSSAGRELGNDGVTLGNLAIITPGQSFTWTETTQDPNVFGAVPDIGATCQLYSWGD